MRVAARVLSRVRSRVKTRLENQSGWQSPITSGLVIDIPGDLLDAQRMKDYSPVGTNHLTLTSGRGVSVDGVTGFGLIPAVGGMLDITSFSVSVWFTGGTINTNDNVIARWDSGANKRVWSVQIETTSPSKIQIRTSADGGAANVKTWISDAQVIVNGTLNFLVFTYNAGTLKVLLNGVEIPGTGEVATTLFNTDVALTLGSNLTSGAVQNSFNGVLRDARFYSLVLDTATCAAINADPELAPYDMTNGLEGKWRCASSLAASLTGMPIIDSSGHGRHGTWTGCVGSGSRLGGPQTAKQSYSSHAWFNGTNQYVTLAEAFSPGTANFHIEFSLFSGNVATGASQRLMSGEDSDTDGIRLLCSSTGVLSAVVNGTAVTTGLTMQSRTKYRIRFQRVGDLFNFVVNGTPYATTEIVGANIAVTTAFRIGARSHTSAISHAIGIIYDIDLNSTLIPGSGVFVEDWRTGCTVTGSPGVFIVPSRPNSTVDAFGDTCNRIRFEGALNLIGDSEYGQFPIASPQAAVTMVAWVKMFNASTGDFSVVCGRDATNDGPVLQVFRTLASVRALLDAATDIGADIPKETWRQIALVYTGTTVEVFINGVGTGSPAAVTMLGTAALLRAGINAFNTASPFRGQLLHPIVFSDAKTGAQLLQLFDFEKSRVGL